MTELDDLLTGRSVWRETLGIVKIADGYDGTVDWHKWPNGNISVKNTPAARKEIATSAYQTEDAWWYPRRWPAKITLLGNHTDDDVVFEVLRVVPRGGNPFQIWINAGTHLIARFVDHSSNIVAATTYLSDYRIVNGIEIPFRWVISRGHKEHDQVVQWETIVVNTVMNVADFSFPKNYHEPITFANGNDTETFPFKLIHNHIFMRVMVNGHPLHFALDTGAFNILSLKTSKALGLHAKGSVAAIGTGTKVTSAGFTTVESLVLGGDVEFRDQLFYVLSLPHSSLPFPLDGIVGYGVFRHLVVRIDYKNHKLTFIKPGKFKPMNAGMPVRLEFGETRTPAIEGSLDGMDGTFEIDTGSSGPLAVFTPFANKHDLYKRYDAADGDAAHEFGIGGHSRAHAVYAGNLMIDKISFNHPRVVLEIVKSGADASKNYSGSIGDGILKNFTVTFDYPHNRMYLKMQ